MKVLPKILLALTAVAALLVAYPAKANLITNPGFETGNLTGWTLTIAFLRAGTFLGISPHSGSFQAVGLAGGFLGQSVATTVGQSYTVDFWAATRSGGLLQVFGGSTVFNHLFLGPTGYTELTFTFTAASASSPIEFFDVTGAMFLDDISVTPTGVPDGGTTVSLLGCALLGLAALRRKLGC